MDEIVIDGLTFSGAKIVLPCGTLLVIRGGNGVLGCGYLNLATAEKLGEKLAVVTGVKNYDDMLNAAVVSVSSAAAASGVTAGMTGREALLKMR